MQLGTYLLDCQTCPPQPTRQKKKLLWTPLRWSSSVRVSASKMGYMKDRDVALKIAIRTKKPLDRKLARKARNRVNILIRNAKNSFVKEKLEQFVDNPKKFWEQIKSVMPNAKLSNPVMLVNDKGNKLNNLETASVINSHFTNIGTMLASELKRLQPGNVEPCRCLYWKINSTYTNLQY